MSALSNSLFRASCLFPTSQGNAEGRWENHTFWKLQLYFVSLQPLPLLCCAITSHPLLLRLNSTCLLRPGSRLITAPDTLNEVDEALSYFYINATLLNPISFFHSNIRHSFQICILLLMERTLWWFFFPSLKKTNKKKGLVHFFENRLFLSNKKDHMTTVLQCIVQALLESIQFLYKCCHLDNKAALLKQAGFILILALLNGEYTLAGEQWTKKRVTNLSWQLHAKEEKTHYDSVVCSASSQDHFQTKVAFLSSKLKALSRFYTCTFNPHHTSSEILHYCTISWTTVRKNRLPLPFFYFLLYLSPFPIWSLPCYFHI